MSREEQKKLTRQRILDAAGRSFRKSGFGGIGVDGLAKAAGVTSGAFYVHFDSKGTAFTEAVAYGMQELKNGIRHFQETQGANWWPEFVRFYLGERRVCDLSESCALQSLSAEVARSDPAARAVFEAALREVAAIVVAGPASAGAPQDEDAAWAALAMLAGTVTLARAVSDPALSAHIAAATERLLLPTATEVTVK